MELGIDTIVLDLKKEPLSDQLDHDALTGLDAEQV